MATHALIKVRRRTFRSLPGGISARRRQESRRMDDPQPAPRTLDKTTVRSAVLFVFWGLALVFIDVTVAVGNPSGVYAIDFLNDTVGYGLVAWGQVRLMGQPGPPTYGVMIRIALVLTLIGLAWSLIVQIAQQVAILLPMLVFTLADLAGVVAFIFAMRELSKGYGLVASSSYWDLTLKVASAMWGALAVLVVGIVASLASPAAGSVGWLGPIVLVGLPLAFVPLLHLGSSLFRMRQELGGPAPEAPGQRIELLVGSILIGVLTLVFFALGFAGPI